MSRLVHLKIHWLGVDPSKRGVAYLLNQILQSEGRNRITADFHSDRWKNQHVYDRVRLPA